MADRQFPEGSLMKEEWYHHGYAVRDLDFLEGEE
jgi:hypothetical protein